jgi:hypothetical protein
LTKTPRLRSGDQMKNLYLSFVVVLSGSFFGYSLTPYIPQSIPYGRLLHPICCFVYSLQFLSWFWTWQLSKGTPHWLRIAALVLIATTAEIVLARILTPIWILSNPPLFLVDTPLVQWTRWTSPFGLSALLYLAVFSAIPRANVYGWRRWTGCLVGSVLVLVLWFGGKLIHQRLKFEDLDFSFALVQTHSRPIPNSPWSPWRDLIRLTDEALAVNSKIDLIVWPENALWPAERSSALASAGTSIYLDKRPITEHENNSAQDRFDFPSVILRYRDSGIGSFLAGCILQDQVNVRKFGLEMPQRRLTNCACL